MRYDIYKIVLKLKLVAMKEELGVAGVGVGGGAGIGNKN
jgi:hypothetical protein